MAHIDATHSIDAVTGDAFTGTGPDTLIVDTGAFILAEASSATGAVLNGIWNITINGEVASIDGTGIRLNLLSASDHATINIGKTGDVYAGDASAIIGNVPLTMTNDGSLRGGEDGVRYSGASFAITNSGSISGGDEGLGLFASVNTVVNSGTISGIVFGGFGTSLQGSGTNVAHIINSGTLNGRVDLAGGDDTFTDFTKIGKIGKSGTVVGVIDLGGGNDHFNGGAKGETVRDGGGGDTIKLGGGNDVYLAVKSAAAIDDTDTINGEKGTDTYDSSSAGSSVFINLDSTFHFVLALSTTIGAHVGLGDDIGHDADFNRTPDVITGFENATGGAGDDYLFGSSGANVLVGGNGVDILEGLGGKDALTGGSNIDTFRFINLADSGVTASTRDLITDFSRNVDKLDLSNIDANEKTAANDAFVLTGHHGLDSFSHSPGQLRYAFAGNQTIVSGDVNGDGKADFSIALLGHVLLHDTDFNL